MAQIDVDRSQLASVEERITWAEVRMDRVRRMVQQARHERRDASEAEVVLSAMQNGLKALEDLRGVLLRSMAFHRARDAVLTDAARKAWPPASHR